MMSLNVMNKKEVNYIDMPAALIEIARAKSEKNNEKLSMLCNFTNEQAIIINSS